LSRYLESLRHGSPAVFLYGVAWSVPQLAQEGLQGVGFVDFASGTTRVVDGGLPEKAFAEMKAASTTSWRSRTVGRLAVGAFRRIGKPAEKVYGPGCLRVREKPGDTCDDVPVTESPERMPNNPLWVLDLLKALDGQSGSPTTPLTLNRTVAADEIEQVLSSSLRRELGAVDPARRIIELRAESSDDGQPRQIAVRIPRPYGLLEPIWEIVLFTGLNVDPSTADRLWDLWHEHAGRSRRR
jgi:hypothetical protein